MFTIAEKSKIKELYHEVWNKIQNEHVICFEGMDKPLFMISTTYPGVWLEHIYDSIMYAWLCEEGKQIARNTIEAFISFRKEDGQLPFNISDGSVSPTGETSVGYSQIQEVVSFAKLAIDIYEKHVKNPEEFWTEYPFPSTAINDSAWKKASQNNCWGY